MAENTTYAELRLAGLPQQDGAKRRDSIQKPVCHKLFCSPLPPSVQRGSVLFLGAAIGLGIYCCCLLAGHGLRIRSVEGDLEGLKQQLRDSQRALERTNETLNKWEKLMTGELQFCMAGWHWNDGKCYFFSTTVKTWDKSKDDCHSKDATLVMIKDNKTMDFIMQHLNGSKFLIGLKKDNYIWKWLDGTELEEYQQVKGLPSKTLTCAKVSSGELSEEPCNSSNRWICEKEAYTFQVLGLSPPPAVLHFGGVRYTGISTQ